MQKIDVLILGAGAAGLFCAIEAGKRGRSVLVLDRANKPGKKILMSGGGRCNFTNYHISPDKYISHNPHFCKSALKRYTQWDFIAMVEKHAIGFHEKTLGQLFCDDKSKAILSMLLAECEAANVTVKLNTETSAIKNRDNNFIVTTNSGVFQAESLVIATGGLSIPTLGSSPFGYKVAEQFGIKVWPTRAGLVPFTLQEKDKKHFSSLSGISLDCTASCDDVQFRENMLFTHRGLSGPAMLQISSYWQSGKEVTVDLAPDSDLLEMLTERKQKEGQKLLKTVLAEMYAKRFIDVFIAPSLASQKLAELSGAALAGVADSLKTWGVKPNGTEGYRTAEVTLGGVDCDAVSSKTMMANDVPGLYFIGEVLDVSGWLGGYNFQWAWSSAFAAGQYV